VQKNRVQARQLMEKNGYGPDKRLKVKVTTRDLPFYRDPAVLLIDQLKEVYFTASSKRSTQPRISQRSGAKISPSGLTCRPAAPIPIRSSTSFTAAVRA
jgi:hypothetical protein